jgi:ABC-type glycerol-3-phosphate transport system substrate-binding protein
VWAWAADWYDKGFTKPTIDASPFVSATQYAVDLVAKHRVAGGGDFTKRNLAMMLSSSWYIRDIEERIMQQNPFKVEMTMLPKGPGGRAVALTNNASYITKGSKAPDATWQFYKHLIGKDVQPQMVKLGGGRYVASKKIKPATLVAYEDLAIYEASAAISRAMPLIAKQADLQTEWAAAWKDMIEGKRGVQAALTHVQEQAARLLKEGGCIC